MSRLILLFFLLYSLASGFPLLLKRTIAQEGKRVKGFFVFFCSVLLSCRSVFRQVQEECPLTGSESQGGRAVSQRSGTMMLSKRAGGYHIISGFSKTFSTQNLTALDKYSMCRQNFVRRMLRIIQLLCPVVLVMCSIERRESNGR